MNDECNDMVQNRKMQEVTHMGDVNLVMQNSIFHMRGAGRRRENGGRGSKAVGNTALGVLVIFRKEPSELCLCHRLCGSLAAL